VVTYANLRNLQTAGRSLSATFSVSDCYSGDLVSFLPLGHISQKNQSVVSSLLKLQLAGYVRAVFQDLVRRRGGVENWEEGDEYPFQTEVSFRRLFDQVVCGRLHRRSLSLRRQWFCNLCTFGYRELKVMLLFLTLYQLLYSVNGELMRNMEALLPATFRPISEEQPVLGSAQTTRPQSRQ